MTSNALYSELKGGIEEKWKSSEDDLEITLKEIYFTGIACKMTLIYLTTHLAQYKSIIQDHTETKTSQWSDSLNECELDYYFCSLALCSFKLSRRSSPESD